MIRLFKSTCSLGMIFFVSIFFPLVQRSFALDEEIDLTSTAEVFTPYLVERESIWILLPLFAISLVLLHLQKFRKKKIQKNIGGWR